MKGAEHQGDVAQFRLYEKNKEIINIVIFYKYNALSFVSELVIYLSVIFKSSHVDVVPEQI